MITRSLTVLAILPILALLIYSIIYPIFITMICPTCFGYHELQDQFYIENGTSYEKSADILKKYLLAQKRVENFLGTLTIKPQVLASTTQSQHDFLNGTQKSADIFGIGTIQLSPNGLTKQIMAHEICRLELRSKFKSNNSLFKLPAWFEKGLILHISEIDKYDNNQGDNASEESYVKKIIFTSDWPEDTFKRQQAVATSLNLVKRWVDKAGASGINEMIKRLQKGEAFLSVYQELGDRP